MKEHIQYDFLFDNHFNELKDAELNLQRVQLATQYDLFVGKYVSSEWIRKNVLMQTEKECKEIDKQRSAEIGAGLAMDPKDVNMFDTMDRQNTSLQPELQNIQAQDSAAVSQQAADDAYKKEMEKIKSTPKPSSSSK